MSNHLIFAIIVGLSALALFFNEQVLKLPKTIALTILVILFSLFLGKFLSLQFLFLIPVREMLAGIDFKVAFLDVLLGYMLFAASLHVNTVTMQKHMLSIFYLASFAVVISTLVIGILLWKICGFFGFTLDFVDCLIFGALISTTDAVAVGSIFSQQKSIPQKIQYKILGESLFNDVTSILVLTILVNLFYTHEIGNITTSKIVLLLIQEAGGGIALGAIGGIITAFILSKTKDHEIAILITLAASSFGYILSQKLHVSGALTMITAGLMTGSLIRSNKVDDHSAKGLMDFWTMVEDLLNSFLIVLMGLELLSIDIDNVVITISIIGIVVVLIARFASLIIPNFLFMDHRLMRYKLKESGVLTWGGIRGGLSLALALSIPNSFPKTLVAVTYVIVVFSILVQGSSFGWLLRKAYEVKEDGIPR